MDTAVVSVDIKAATAATGEAVGTVVVVVLAAVAGKGIGVARTLGMVVPLSILAPPLQDFLFRYCSLLKLRS